MRYVTVTTVGTDPEIILMLFVKCCYTVWTQECDMPWVLRE